jgi:hypothetical protein
VFGLAIILRGLVLLVLVVLAFIVLAADGLVVVPDSLLVGTWTGRLTE